MNPPVGLALSPVVRPIDPSIKLRVVSLSNHKLRVPSEVEASRDRLTTPSSVVRPRGSRRVKGSKGPPFPLIPNQPPYNPVSRKVKPLANASQTRGNHVGPLDETPMEVIHMRRPRRAGPEQQPGEHRGKPTEQALHS